MWTSSTKHVPKHGDVPDRPELQFAAEELARDVSKRTERSELNVAYGHFLAREHRRHCEVTATWTGSVAGGHADRRAFQCCSTDNI